tara:strand:+ start:267 stop:1031 length:765 start_codon:yes stop_codon:yes gene_type:complete
LYFYFSKILAPFLKLTNFLILVIILSLILKKLFSKKYFKQLRYFAIFSFLIICLFPIGNLGLKFLEKNYYNQPKISNIDNIIVLAGSENIQLTKITKKLNLNSASERLIASVKLANQYQNSKIFFLGGDGNLIKNSVDEIFVAKQFYSDVDFDLERIKYLDNTRNTYENLKKFRNIKKKNEVNVLITSAFHMNRSLMIANKLNIKLIPYAVDYRSSNFNSIINYYQSFSITKNLATFDIFFREMLGILAIKLFY